jgi:hypothetical protein
VKNNHYKIRNGDVYNRDFVQRLIATGRSNITSRGKGRDLAADSLDCPSFISKSKALPMLRSRNSSYRGPVNMKPNLTGRSIRGGGGLGTSRSPCSQSGMDPALPRGKSSQLDYAIVTDESKIRSITKSF